MSLVFKWLSRTVIGVCILGLLLLYLAYYLASGSIPEYRGRFTVEGLNKPIEIVRDTNAVPHILAQTTEDGYFGLGYVHAQDRLWQMEVLRRTAQGRLSELFGRSTLRADRLMRMLDLYRLSVRTAENQRPETLAALNAYADGVNAFLTLVRQEAWGRGAPELFLFTDQISPWTAADSIAVQKLMALNLTSQAAKDIQRAALSLHLSGPRLRDFVPDEPNEAIVALREYASLFPGLQPKRMAAAAPIDDHLALNVDPWLAGASNAFAANGTRTASGQPLLATDPHLGLQAPGFWLLAHIRFPDTDVIGGTIPGLPGIVIGRNTEFGWGLTTAYVDDQDVYLEQVNPENEDEYKTPDGWERFRKEDVLIGVDGDATEKVTLRWTRHGPVFDKHTEVYISGNPNARDSILKPGHVLSLSWTALSDKDRSIEALLRLMHAKNIEEARVATRLHRAPAQNVIMADKSRIALQVAGVAPLRAPTHQGLGRLPAPGWVAGNDWLGELPFEDMPFVLNPPGGIVVNTNNRTSDALYPRHLNFDWGDSIRIRRAAALLDAREFHSRDSFVEIQTDIISEAARALLPLMARNLWWTGQPAPTDRASRLRQIALKRLADWNGEMGEHAPEPLIFVAWLDALKTRIALDELGPLLDQTRRIQPAFFERVLRNVEGAEVWCDVTKTVPKEDCTTIARQALDDAIAMLSERYGDQIESWRWGDAHRAIQKHPVLGTQFPFSLFVNITQPTSGGDFTMMRGVMRHRGPEPFSNVHASGLRAVYDFADPNGSVYIIATGQSGHPLSRHYDDLSELWRRGDYIRMSMEVEEARGGALGVTILAPLEE